MKLLFFLLIVSSVLLDPFKFTFCYPKEKSQFVVTALDIIPVKPKGGQNLIVNFTGSVEKSIANLDNGKVDVIVQMGSTIFDTYHYDLCKVMHSGCPIPEGVEEGTITHIVPKLLLPGTYNLTTVVRSTVGGKEQEICCVSTNLQLVW